MCFRASLLCRYLVAGNIIPSSSIFLHYSRQQNRILSLKSSFHSPIQRHHILCNERNKTICLVRFLLHLTYHSVQCLPPKLSHPALQVRLPSSEVQIKLSCIYLLESIASEFYFSQATSTLSHSKPPSGPSFTLPSQTHIRPAPPPPSSALSSPIRSDPSEIAGINSQISESQIAAHP